MTITRILPGVVLLVLATAGSAAAQPGSQPPYPLAGRSTAPLPPLPSDVADLSVARKSPTGTLERITAPIPPGGAVGESDPLGTLTGQSERIGLPPGAYGSPWYADAPGCCGPLGRNGSVNYELYTTTGPNFAFGSGAFTDRLHLGWNVGGGGRTQFFNQAGDAAWAIDLGLSYTYNRGANDDFVDLFLRQPPLTNPVTNRTTPQADRFVTTRIRALHRSSFNFAVGRDWFYWGNGVPGSEETWNLRIGTNAGGRWGTAHVDLVPFGEPDGYSRRQGVYHGVFLGLNTNLEVPMGGWIFFVGSRVEYGYDWMNIVPPLKGDVQNLNLLISSGIRF